MSTKTKNPTKPEKLLELAQQTGLILMTAAVTLGMMELPNRPNSRIIIPSQPAFGMANEQDELNNNNVLRRENEESEKSYVSYSVTQRTPARSGRR